MSYHDIALICLNGHVVNEFSIAMPDNNREHCTECGAKTINKCPKCKADIIGGYVGDFVGSYLDEAPAYCHNCGSPYPWTDNKTIAESATQKGAENESLKSIKIKSEELDALAKIIVDYHTKSKIPDLFEKAGFNWVTCSNSIKEETWYNMAIIQDSSGSVLSVIEALCDPEEFIDEPQKHKKFLKKVNGILMDYGIFITRKGKVVKNIKRDKSQCFGKHGLEALFRLPDFHKIIEDEKLIEIMNKRWEELNICYRNNAWLATIILTGSILEGILFEFARKYPKEANQAKASPKDKDKNGKEKVRQFKDWTFANFLDVALECGWIGSYAYEFGNFLREYRNMVHPQKQLELQSKNKKEYPDSDACEMCLLVVHNVVRNLIEWEEEMKNIGNKVNPA